jgi:uncharacterized peroxidase-related enzyme
MKFLMKVTAVFMMSLGMTLSVYATEMKPKEVTVSDPLIDYVSIDKATGDVKAVYEEIIASFGMVPEPIKLLSLNPAMLRNQWESYKVSMSNKNFSMKLGAMMRMLVAENNDCKYCVGFNKGMLMNMMKISEDEIEALKKDPSTTTLDEKEKAMLLHMIKATRTPHSVSKLDIDNLKKLGWSEKDIMEGTKQATDMVSMTLLIDTFKLL